MVVQTDAIAAYLAELTVVEDDVLRHARDRAAAGGMPPVSADAGAFLRLAAGWVGAQAAVEIGSGAGYSGVWIARGLADKGILTTIEADPGHQRLAKETYEEAGVPSRIRAILGRALDVLPRLTDGGYDLAFLDAVKAEYPEYLEHALRLVRPGGVIIADNVLWSGRVTDPKATDPDTEGLRAYARALFGGDTEKMSHPIAATTKRKILQALTSDRVVKAMRMELVDSYRAAQGVGVALDDAGTRSVISDVFGIEEL